MKIKAICFFSDLNLVMGALLVWNVDQGCVIDIIGNLLTIRNTVTEREIVPVLLLITGHWDRT